MAWADGLVYLNTPASVARAVELEPGNASYRGLLAEHDESGGKDPKPALLIATRLSPLESRYWERIAFRQEMERDYGRAEESLLHAAETDHLFAPRWALANYYLRRGNTEKFWVWITKSLEVAPPEPEAIFQMAWGVTQDGGKIRSLLPPGRALLQRYLSWLVNNRMVEAAKGPALEISPHAMAEDLPALLAYCEQAANVDVRSALLVWNALCTRHLLPYPAISPGQGQVVTDPTFQSAGTGGGFSWELARQPGLSVYLAGARDGAIVELRGRQAERSMLLQQRVPVFAKSRYKLSWEYRVTGNRGPTGLHWEIVDQTTDRNILEGAAPLGGTEFRTDEAVFESRSDMAPRLSLIYRREPGMVPWEGTLYLRSVRMERTQ